MLALDLYEADICDCGFHKSLAHDPKRMFDLDSVTCPLCADLAARARLQAREDEAEETALREKPKTKRRADGRRWLVKMK